MGYCATLTLHDSDGDALHTIRYGCVAEGDADQLCAGLAGDAWTLLQKRPDLQVSLLCDGAPEMWNRLGAHITHEALGVEVHRLVDYWHLVEKLGKAASVLDGQAASAILSRWRLRLLNTTQPPTRSSTSCADPAAKTSAMATSALSTTPSRTCRTTTACLTMRMHAGMACPSAAATSRRRSRASSSAV
jgi:hypothetical protein